MAFSAGSSSCVLFVPWVDAAPTANRHRFAEDAEHRCLAARSQWCTAALATALATALTTLGTLTCQWNETSEWWLHVDLRSRGGVWLHAE
mmetsp:Transcript_50550/g.131521  ORF Transcript_50550/g.131521 Transcript_50550/m.131521 type:complete len:90 (-) Transcript_50550:43-312(-)